LLSYFEMYVYAFQLITCISHPPVRRHNLFDRKIKCFSLEMFSFRICIFKPFHDVTRINGRTIATYETYNSSLQAVSVWCKIQVILQRA
jgi:hypothetical protein